MADYIDREQAIKAAIDAVDDWDGGGNRIRAMIIKLAIEDLPVADVRENVHGHWIDKTLEFTRGGTPVVGSFCSVCDEEGDKFANFCDSCGADMREGNDNS